MKLPPREKTPTASGPSGSRRGDAPPQRRHGRSTVSGTRVPSSPSSARLAAFIGLVALIWAALAAGAGADDPPKKRPAPRTRREAQSGVGQEPLFRAIYPQAPRTLDPHAGPDPAAWPVIMATYHRLVTLEKGTAKPAPDMVSAVRVSPDGLKYTFQLREGLTFADGTALNSEAALFSFDRLMSTEVGRRYFPYLHRFEIIGASSFRLVLKRPWPPFLASLALPQASLVSPGLRDRPADYLRQHTLGNGPYVVYDWRDDTIGLQARPDVATKPRVVFAMFHYEPDPHQRYAKMLAHDAHLTVDPALPAEGLPPHYQRKLVPSFGVRYLAFNTRRPYTRMQSARRALGLVIGEAFRDHPGRLTGPFPPGLFYNAPARTAPPDLGQADQLAQGRQIIREIGPPARPLVLVHQVSDPEAPAEARRIAEALAGCGLAVDIQPLTDERGCQMLEDGDYDLLLDTRTPDIPSADMWLGQFLDANSSAGGNPAFFNHPRARQLIAEIADTVGQGNDGPQELRRLDTERANKVAQLAEIARDEVPYLFLYQIERPLVVDVRLTDQEPHPMWPEVWPISETSLKPFSFRSGANPTGRRPGPPAAPQGDSPAPAAPSVVPAPLPATPPPADPQVPAAEASPSPAVPPAASGAVPLPPPAPAPTSATPPPVDPQVPAVETSPPPAVPPAASGAAAPEPPAPVGSAEEVLDFFNQDQAEIPPTWKPTPNPQPDDFIGTELN